MTVRNFVNFFFVISIFLIDRFSKLVMINSSTIDGSSNVLINDFLSFNLVWNDGIAFGLFSFDQKIYYNFLTAIILLITLIILWMILKTKGLEKIAFMMILGGSTGNIFDRLYYSSVPDFIDIHYGNFHWFIFNVADIFISIGVLLLIILEIFIKNKV
tara:strand:- start:1156 stop:1629 length:474 start_codon:yes stop_codon:yes gene_type:complete